MPPKQRFSKDEIITAALNIIRRDGIDAVTARSLGTELGSSTHPVFTVFQNMDEVQREAIQAARNLYNDYTEIGLASDIAFKGVGMQYVRFACDEPRLFELLFMSAGETSFTLDEVLPAIDDNSDRILASIQENYSLERDVSYKLYRKMWIFTHGIACICATGMSNLTEDEISTLLTDTFTALLMKIKSEEKEKGK